MHAYYVTFKICDAFSKVLSCVLDAMQLAIYVHKSIVKPHRNKAKHFGTGNVEKHTPHRLVWIGNVIYLVNYNYCVPSQSYYCDVLCVLGISVA